MTKNEILIGAVSYFKDNANEEAEPHDIFDLSISDPENDNIMATLLEFDRIFLNFPQMGLLRMCFNIRADMYHLLLRNSPEDFLKEYERIAKAHNVEVVKEQERQKKKDQILDLTIDDLVDKVIKSPKVEGRLRRAEIISIASVLVGLGSMIAAIAMLKGC